MWYSMHVKWGSKLHQLQGDKLFKFLFYCECGFKFEAMFCIF